MKSVFRKLEITILLSFLTILHVVTLTVSQSHPIRHLFFTYKAAAELGTIVNFLLNFTEMHQTKSL